MRGAKGRSVCVGESSHRKCRAQTKAALVARENQVEYPEEHQRAEIGVEGAVRGMRGTVRKGGCGRLPRLSRARRFAHASTLFPVRVPLAFPISKSNALCSPSCFLPTPPQDVLCPLLYDIQDTTTATILRQHGCTRDGQHLFTPPRPPRADGEAGI